MYGCINKIIKIKMLKTVNSNNNIIPFQVQKPMHDDFGQAEKCYSIKTGMCCQIGILF